MAKILVTGGAGFIGHHVSKRLLERGDDVSVLDNFDNYYDSQLKVRNLDFIPDAKITTGDIRDKDRVRHLFREAKPDRIVHLAAQAGVRYSIDHPDVVTDVNVKGTLNMLDIAAEFGVEHFVFASSSSVYGNNRRVPFSEEDKTDSPISPYAASKKACEAFAHTYYHLHDLPCTGLRFFTVYGPRSRPDMAHRKFADLMMENEVIPVYGDGSMSRDFTYVDDIVDGIVSALDRPNGFRVFNLGNTHPYSVMDLIEHLEEGLNVKAKISYKPEQPGDVERTFADITKAGRELGYSPKVKFGEGMRRFCEWYRGEHGM